MTIQWMCLISVHHTCSLICYLSVVTICCHACRSGGWCCIIGSAVWSRHVQTRCSWTIIPNASLVERDMEPLNLQQPPLRHFNKQWSIVCAHVLAPVMSDVDSTVPLGHVAEFPFYGLGCGCVMWQCWHLPWCWPAEGATLRLCIQDGG